MLINFIRSSSIGTYSMCPMQYFQDYVLGMPSSSGKKATQGTIVHKVMEILANCKKTMQESDQNSYEFNDEHIGMVKWNKEEFLKPYQLQTAQIEEINKSRINKYKYKYDTKLKYGTIRYGVNLVNRLFERAYDYYSEDDWYPVDKKDCHNWTWIALEYKDGIFDPRKREIVAAEPHFDIEIKKPWAQYEWTLPTGEKISGNLRIKGTIDLITRVGDTIIEITDYKVGRRIDWTSQKDNDIKTYTKLCNDFQLLLYYYAACHMYPNNQIITSIFFIRDGGPFTICPGNDAFEYVENILKDKFEEIKNCQLPAMQDSSQKNFKCTKLCDYYKMVAPNGDNMCKFLHDKIKKEGIEYVTNTYMKKGFSIGTYESPGG